METSVAERVHRIPDMVADKERTGDGQEFKLHPSQNNDLPN